MAQLGKKSLEKLAECDPRWLEICEVAIQSYDFTVAVGKRSKADQDKAFAEGKSKLKYPNSKHNTEPLSMAVDLVPFPIDWDDLKRFYFLAGIVIAAANSLGYKIRWGGDWNSNGDFKDNSFNDLPHFELVD